MLPDSMKVNLRSPLNTKHINSKPIRRRQSRTRESLSPIDNRVTAVPTNENRDDRHEKLGQLLNHQNISCIVNTAEESFMSNKQDQSLDSLNHMIIEVDDQRPETEKECMSSMLKDEEMSYSQLYQEFCELIGKKELLEPKFFKNKISEPKVVNFLSPGLFQSPERDKKIESNFQEDSEGIEANLKSRLEEIKEMRANNKGMVQQFQLNHSGIHDQSSTSLRLLGANVSEIHEEDEGHQNNSINRMDPIEEEFIDFVSNNENRGEINLSKIMNENVSRTDSPKNDNGLLQLQSEGNQERRLDNSEKEIADEVGAMLENELESKQTVNELIVNKETNKIAVYDNYNQILIELNDQEDKKMEIASLCKREKWITSQKDRSIQWKEKRMKELQRIRTILENPYTISSEEESLEEKELEQLKREISN